MNLFSLNALIDDIILTFRNNNISESENLSRTQVEKWIHHYRALLFKQELDKGYEIDEDYIQTISPFHISKHYGNFGEVYYESDDVIPKFITTHHNLGLMFVKDMHGNLIQIGSETKAKFQSARKYTCKNYIAYVRGNKLYILGPEHLEFVQIGGVLEDPTAGDTCFDYDNTTYPMPKSMVPALKQMIFANELNIMLEVPSDKTNNSTNDVRQ